ncbi:hypothetical protein Tco_0670131, partial [Tanacetum coccineum]
MSVERRGLTASGAINSYLGRVLTNRDGTTVPISTIFGRLKIGICSRAIVAPISLPVQGGYKMRHFKGMSYKDIRPIFEKVWDQIHSFVPMESELEIPKLKRAEPVKRQSTKEEKKIDDSSKAAEGRRKKTLARKRASGKDSEESMKKQKLEDDTEKEDLKAYLDIISRDDVAIDIESLGTKYPIIDWKTYVLAKNFMYYQIFRADGSSMNYKIFSEMLDDFERQDVLDLHRLVKA